MSLLTIREIKERTEAFFKSKGVPNARLDTDTLIAHSLGMKRLELYLDLDRPLTEAQLVELRPLVKRRADREPLQYIVGTVDFCDMELKVDPRALIPRYETEELVELVCEALTETPNAILDLGTGSGALALAFANKYPEAAVDAVDFSAEALSLAKENVAAQGLEARVTLHEGSWLCPLGLGEERYDLIVSNPPYLTEEEMTTAEPEVVAHEPHSALVSGADGLDDLRLIFKDAAAHLKPGGLLALETGIAQTETLNALCEAAGLKGESLEDLSGRPRFYFARKG
ncbi:MULTISPECIES: peptide chain release factor N(5)-glutamine methyltransferase [unclassified Lentimonas]|uniref:peptide chain release factor N(5)-glutamine methyltransferase n=1 Tax=unclassified Lentimonas TaxID=2630993 RepID=UPI001329FE5E|nr:MULTISPECIES: peptide chain release factor N(5)-glutamine methyltransferase [unclassified Lentimonas]CAA6697346.1 Protein-N(5)-glutamine methyltransferase PrmC, methylates polypeptide chain release factors RF1 and RF2 [Lentimonas sp. CC19]CAA6697640.1 Protein-N(5)-glutamine methyltransferase PrmC, methylates polypeptide chain release factors RF1 and RF2 [Lentimonas sp. CC10]CAA7071201.1 Protein-N(5)-glutamine methyltransferase PrmC, methylates polypeptide chain release factors RF1 and RF2 [Le